MESTQSLERRCIKRRCTLLGLCLRQVEVFPARPIGDEHAFGEVTMDAGPTPILRAAHKTVLDRIPVNVRDVASPIVLVVTTVKT